MSSLITCTSDSTINHNYFFQVLTEEQPKHFYVIAIAVNANDAPNDVQRVYMQLALTKMTIYITHLLSGVALALSVQVGIKLLRIIAPVFAVTQLFAFIYTAVECSFTIFQLVDPTSRGLVVAAMLVSCFSMLMCVVIVSMYTKNASDAAQLKKQYYCTTTTTPKLVANNGRQRHQKHLVAFYKDIQNDLLLPDKANNTSDKNNDNSLTNTNSKVADV